MRLCYARYPYVYFTSDFDKQWGDDWDDAPYEHNAGEPYKHNTKVFVLILLGPWRQPCDGYCNSPYSVEQINERKLAWIKFSNTEISAGTELHDFLDSVLKYGLRVMDTMTYEKLQGD